VLLLGEPFTWRIGAGAALITAGLLVLAGGK
jgi:drug/metabolite transporter (DMT)-like permease